MSLTFRGMSDRALGLGHKLTRQSGGYEFSGERFKNLTEVDARLDELAALRSDTIAFCNRLAFGPWFHLVMTATNSGNVLDRRRVIDSRGQRRSARRRLAELAKKHKMTEVAGEWRAPRLGGGEVKLWMKDCPSGPTCQGSCVGEPISAPVEREQTPQQSAASMAQARASALAAMALVMGAK